MHRPVTGARQPIARDMRSITDVLVDIGGNVQDILRSEIRLARSEVSEQLAQLRSAGALVLTGLVAALLGAIFLLLAALFGLRLVMPSWAAALIIGGALVIIAAVGLAMGRLRLSSIRPAHRTVERIEENAAWARQQTRSRLT